MELKSIHTTKALQLMAEAEGSGTQIRLTHMAVGDGNGNPVTPLPSQTQLVRERFRAPVNRVYQNPDIPNMFTAELLIPASEGGYTLREVGVFDSNGNLFIVGNLPDTYKPTDADGAYSDTVIRVAFMVTNASIVELKIDPNVVIATQSWIINNINPALLFPGGTTGQILRKKSNTDGDTEWSDPTIANVVVDVIEERQTLAASQTAVNWATVTNTGLAVYIEGIRLLHDSSVDGWQVDTTQPDTKIILGKSYPDGTRILGVQNEPLGATPLPLEASKNLSDVPDKQVARENLGVFSKEETRLNGLPPGAIISVARNTAPSGYLKANGAAVSRATYADLFAAIGTTFGTGDGFNTFNLPDLRGEFVRGWADGRNVDSGRAFGSFQADEIKKHNHLDVSAFGGTASGTASTSSRYAKQFYSPQSALKDVNGVTDATGLYSQDTGGTETRPRNVALLYCIKF
ncbi:putative tail fiber protein [Acinetobacter phage vB_AbaP_Alexa]|nr:putative tail fiber protein [Acinetobacter phage vB_AbaP_Alexa]